MPKFNVTKRRGKAKIKIADKRKAAMSKIIDTFSEDLDIRTYMSKLRGLT